MNCKASGCSNITEFSCDDNNKCIHNLYVCDGTAHCMDGSDEDPSRCGMQTCQMHYLWSILNNIVIISKSLHGE